MTISDIEIKPKYSFRDCCILKLPVNENLEIRHPELIVLKLGEKYFDIGSFCYADRPKAPKLKSKPKLVNEASLVQSRLAVIEKVIRIASLLTSRLRLITLMGMLEAFGYFINYADDNNFDEIFDFRDSSLHAFSQYTGNVYVRYRQGEIKGTRGQALQKYVLNWLRALSENPNFGAEVRLISLANNSGKEETLPAHQSKFSHILAMTQMIFEGMTTLILTNATFPFKLDLPNSLNWTSGNHLWVFPTQVWFLPPRYWGKCRAEIYRPGWIYDYENGVLSQVNDVWMHYGGETEGVKRHRATTSLLNAKKLLKSANSDPRHFRRLHFAKLAFYSFMYLFFANTGVNPSVLAEIETEEEIDSSAVNQSYRAIKYRAKGTIVTVRVPVSFMPHLRKFMELRKFILGGIRYPLLFFRFNKFENSIENLKPIGTDPLEHLLRTLQDIDPYVAGIKPRQMRVTLNDWQLRSNDVAVVAKIMSHSLQTENRKYGRGSPIDHQQEMTSFLEWVAIAAKSQKVTSEKVVALGFANLEQGGQCIDFGNPIGMLDDEHLQPGCNKNCWFCSSRQIVADEDDVRKIASAIFVIERFISGPDYERALRPLVQKCESDLNLISSKENCEAMVKRIKVEVFEQGRLTPYWAEKYNQYLELGMII